MDEESSLGCLSLVHLDLKRSPLKVEFLEKVFPLFRAWGATGLLIEWEDTFPYSKDLEPIGSQYTPSEAYTDHQIQRILRAAEDAQLFVIPLVQTFGHLEFVLRHEAWEELREVETHTNALCPSIPESLPLVTAMIDQVLAKMPQSLEYFHIGSDEVWQLGSCRLCSVQDKHVLLLTHVCGVLKHLKDNYPHLRPIMWDDMLRTVPASLIEAHNLHELVDIMVWYYEPAPLFNIPEDLWNKYTTLFPDKLWIASAYKGATGACQILPVIEHHVSNHLAWLAQLNRIGARVKGIALTGWSRYDHYATLCELLPSALPCLALCLAVCREGGYSEELHKKVSHALGYTEVPLPTNPYPRPQQVAPALNFPGWKIATGVEWFANLKGKHSEAMNSDQIRGWLNPWQLNTGFISPMQIQGIVQTLFNLTEEWSALEKYLREHLEEAYFPTEVAEWIGTNCTPLREKAVELYTRGRAVLEGQLGPESPQLLKKTVHQPPHSPI